MGSKMVFYEELLEDKNGVDLFEEFNISDHLYQSNLSEVLMLYSLKDDSKYVLKVIYKELNGYVDFDTIEAVKNKGVVPIIRFFETKNYYFLVKPFIEGQALNNIVNESNYLDIHSSYEMILKVAEILKCIHNQPKTLILRDLKPENIIITKNNTPILIDLESSRVHKNNDSNDTVILGTPGYASPEQYGFRETDVRSDIYSLGMLLCFLLSGEIYKHKDGLSDKLDSDGHKIFGAVISKATEFDPDMRYQSVESFIQNVKERYKRYNYFKINKLRIPMVILTIFFISILVYQQYQLKSLKEENSMMTETLIEEHFFGLDESAIPVDLLTSYLPTEEIKSIQKSNFVGGKPEFLMDIVNVNPKTVYYNDNGQLVMDAYVTNGLDSTIHNINVENLNLTNESNELICVDNIENLGKLVLDSQQSAVWTFTFSDDELFIKNSNLESLRIKSNTTYKFTKEIKSTQTSNFVNGTPQFLINSVNVNPKTVYYNDNGQLVMDAYVTNGLDSTIYNINVENLNLTNGSNELICDAYMGSLDGLALAPQQSAVWTFTFGGDTLFIKNSNLESLRTKSNTSYNY